MKTRNTFLALALLAAAGFLFNVTRAGAASGAAPVATTESFKSSGMAGLTIGQTARLNVVNLETGELLPAVQVELSFLDAEGNTLAQKVHGLQRGQAAFFDLNGAQAGRTGRTQIRAQVRFIGTPDTRVVQKVLPTLEVVDNATGRTAFIVPIRDDPFFRTN